MNLAYEDANPKLVEVVTVADVDAEKRVGNSLLQIRKVKFGIQIKSLFRLSAQGLVKILKFNLRHDFKPKFGQFIFLITPLRKILFFCVCILLDFRAISPHETRLY